jgi:hypothetical protein
MGLYAARSFERPPFFLGADRAAFMMTLIMTAKISGVEAVGFDKAFAANDARDGGVFCQFLLFDEKRLDPGCARQSACWRPNRRAIGRCFRRQDRGTFRDPGPRPFGVAFY